MSEDTNMKRRIWLAFILFLCLGNAAPATDKYPHLRGYQPNEIQAYAYFERARAYVNQNKFAEAIEYYKKALQADPRSSVLRTYYGKGTYKQELAHAQYLSGDYKAAFETYMETLVEDPDDIYGLTIPGIELILRDAKDESFLNRWEQLIATVSETKKLRYVKAYIQLLSRGGYNPKRLSRVYSFVLEYSSFLAARDPSLLASSCAHMSKIGQVAYDAGVDIEPVRDQNKRANETCQRALDLVSQQISDKRKALPGNATDKEIMALEKLRESLMEKLAQLAMREK